MRSLKRLLLLFILSAVILPASAGSVRLSLSMQRGQREIGVGDLFYITYEVTDIDAQAQRPASAPGAKIMYFDRTSQSSRFSSVNGHTTQSFSYTYTLTLRAEKEGRFSFGPVTIGGARSNAVSYTIGKSSSKNSPTQSNASQSQASASGAPKYIGKGDGNLFLRASVSKTSAYEQEALVYTVKLYTSYDRIKFIGATTAPKFEGFVVEESKSVSSSLSYETYNGKTYATAIIARYIIFPQMKGSLKVIGNTYTVSVDQREYYHDPFWGNMSVSSPLQLNVTPNDLSVNVRPLPSPQPADFSGGVGQFSISASMPRTSLLTNQPASIVYTVSGSGNLKYVRLPDLQSLFPSELEVYSPTTDVKTSVGASNVSGSVRFDYSLMPLEEGDFSIPPVTLTYFDPVAGQYRKVSSRGFSLSVGKGKTSARSQTTNRLRFISDLKNADPARISARHIPLVHSVLYWLFFAVPVIILIAAVAVYRKHLRDMADMAGLMSRKAGKIARSRLKKAYRCLTARDSEHFYDETLAAIWGYLAHRLKMPTSELNRENVAARLSSIGISESLIGKTIRLLDNVEFAKYSPDKSDADMSRIYDEAAHCIESFVRSLRKNGTIESGDSDAGVSLSSKLDKELSDKQ